jgi:histidinol dehydrogenase
MENRGLLVSSAHNRYCCVSCKGMELVWQWVCLCRYTKRFDGVDLEKIVERVCDLPDPVLDSDVKAAFDVAYDNIYVFHAAQRKTQQLQVETMPGVQCWRVARAVNAVGLYVPGGTAVLPSTALMLAVVCVLI